MLFQSRINTLMFLLTVLAIPSKAQNARSSPGYQSSQIGFGQRDSNELGVSDFGLTAYARSASTAPTADDIGSLGSAFLKPLLESSINFEKVCSETANRVACFGSHGQPQPNATRTAQQSADSSSASENSRSTSGLIAQSHARPDRNLDIYYRNRREFSLDVGWHPVNIPFIYDFAVGGGYNMTPLKYTLVPMVASLRWHVTNVGWRWIFRGNMDFTFSGSLTVIPRGPETHYYSLDFGIRRNFVYRNWKVVPFFEQSGGAGIINAKEPLGVLFAQGQNLTFTYNLGVGARYNIDSKYSFSAGMNYMHISNGYLSQPQFYNYGINVYGPLFGINVRLGSPRRHDSE